MTDREILPSAIVPRHYGLSLYDLAFAPSWSYTGALTIDCKVVEPVREAVLNVKNITVKSAKISVANDLLSEAVEIEYDERTERVTLKFPKDIPTGDNVQLGLTFTATINDHMAGFCRAKYTSAVEPHAATPKDDKSCYMFSTQFEACDARQAFPCFDEPKLKATFDFEIEIPKGLTALSNMPVKGTRSGSSEALEVVSFERTPVMSTYLLAWAFGDFTYVETHTDRKYDGKQKPVRVYTTRGLESQARLAVGYASRTIDYFSEIFDVDYPLPKMDMLAVHEFAMGAMENWGLVTYRTVAILFEEGKSDDRYKNIVPYIIAHELAHQWFGNLVTMDWWSELWLNEGFATWVGWNAIDHFHPERQIWSQFTAETLEPARELDSLRASHPIEVPVKNALEVDQIFDKISYLKGSSVIRMLAVYLGLETFFKGVSNYLKAHAYGNATTKNLWDALSEASNQDIGAYMDNWIRKIGYPLITVQEENNKLLVSQKRFLSSGDVQGDEDQTVWWVPLSIRTTAPSNNQAIGGQITTEKRDVPFEVDTSNFYKVNANTAGFYRTLYPASRLAQLGHHLELLSTEDKIGLLGDASALAVSGDHNTSSLLILAEGFHHEENTLVWNQLQTSLLNLLGIFASNEKITAALKKYTLRLVSRAVDDLGWEFTEGEDYLRGRLRQIIISLAGHAGHDGVVKEARRRFSVWASGEDVSAIHNNLRAAIFRTVVSEGGKSEYDTVKAEYHKTTSLDGKVICLGAMTATQVPELYQDAMEFLVSPHVAIQDIHIGAKSFASNPVARQPFWQFIKKRWSEIERKLTANKVVLNRFLSLGLEGFTDVETADDIVSFFADKDQSGFDRGLKVVLDTVRTNAAYRSSDEGSTLEWLESNGY